MPSLARSRALTAIGAIPVIRATTRALSNAFPSLTFAVDPAEMPYFEVLLTTSAALFHPQNAGQRTAQNFYASRVDGLIRTEDAYGNYIAPVAVISGFAQANPDGGQVYYTIVGYADAAGNAPVPAAAPEVLARSAASVPMMPGFRGHTRTETLGVPLSMLKPAVRTAALGRSSPAVSGRRGVGLLSYGPPGPYGATIPAVEDPRSADRLEGEDGYDVRARQTVLMPLPMPQPSTAPSNGTQPGNGARPVIPVPPPPVSSAAPPPPPPPPGLRSTAPATSGIGGGDDAFRCGSRPPDYDDGWGAWDDASNGHTQTPAGRPRAAAQPFRRALRRTGERRVRRPGLAGLGVRRDRGRSASHAGVGDPGRTADSHRRAEARRDRDLRRTGHRSVRRDQRRRGVRRRRRHRPPGLPALSPRAGLRHRRVLQDRYLGQLLILMNDRDAAKFAEIFGPDHAELLTVTNRPGPLSRDVPDGRSTRVQPVAGSDLWTEPWLSRFRAAGAHLPFRGAPDPAGGRTVPGPGHPVRQRPRPGHAARVGDHLRPGRPPRRGQRDDLGDRVGRVRSSPPQLRDQALRAVGAESVEAFQRSQPDLLVDDQFGPLTHAALTGMLRALVAAGGVSAGAAAELPAADRRPGLSRHRAAVGRPDRPSGRRLRAFLTASKP